MIGLKKLNAKDWTTNQRSLKARSIRWALLARRKFIGSALTALKSSKSPDTAKVRMGFRRCLLIIKKLKKGRVSKSDIEFALTFLQEYDEAELTNVLGEDKEQVNSTSDILSDNSAIDWFLGLAKKSLANSFTFKEFKPKLTSNARSFTDSDEALGRLFKQATSLLLSPANVEYITRCIDDLMGTKTRKANDRTRDSLQASSSAELSFQEFQQVSFTGIMDAVRADKALLASKLSAMHKNLMTSNKHYKKIFANEDESSFAASMAPLLLGAFAIVLVKALGSALIDKFSKEIEDLKESLNPFSGMDLNLDLKTEDVMKYITEAAKMSPLFGPMGMVNGVMQIKDSQIGQYFAEKFTTDMSLVPAFNDKILKGSVVALSPAIGTVIGGSGAGIVGALGSFFIQDSASAVRFLQGSSELVQGMSRTLAASPFGWGLKALEKGFKWLTDSLNRDQEIMKQMPANPVMSGSIVGADIGMAGMGNGLGNNSKFGYDPTGGKGRLTSPFGKRTHPVTGEKGKFHNGIDVAAPVGTPIYSPAPGIVTFSGMKGNNGNLVTINHGNGLVTAYAHNSRNVVKQGQTVTAGQNIALMGSTGRSTGSHVHFSVIQNGTHVDPTKMNFGSLQGGGMALGARIGAQLGTETSDLASGTVKQAAQSGKTATVSKKKAEAAKGETKTAQATKTTNPAKEAEAKRTQQEAKLKKQASRTVTNTVYSPQITHSLQTQITEKTTQAYTRLEQTIQVEANGFDYEPSVLSEQAESVAVNPTIITKPLSSTNTSLFSNVGSKETREIKNISRVEQDKSTRSNQVKPKVKQDSSKTIQPKKSVQIEQPQQVESREISNTLVKKTSVTSSSLGVPLSASTQEGFGLLPSLHTTPTMPTVLTAPTMPILFETPKSNSERTESAVAPAKGLKETFKNEALSILPQAANTLLQGGSIKDVVTNSLSGLASKYVMPTILNKAESVKSDVLSGTSPLKAISKIFSKNKDEAKDTLPRRSPLVQKQLTEPKKVKEEKPKDESGTSGLMAGGSEQKNAMSSIGSSGFRNLPIYQLLG